MDAGGVATRAAACRAENREEEERKRLTGGPGGEFLFSSFFSLGCDTRDDQAST